MRKYGILGLCSILILGINFSTATRSLGPTTDQILTTQDKDIITPPDQEAMRQWSHDIIHSKDNDKEIGNLIESTTKIESQKDVTKRTLDRMHKLINYALGMLSLVAFCVLLYAGFQMTTAAGDDGKFKAGNKTLKKIAIWIAGIAISRFVVSGIFRLLKTVMNL